jgi:hypothetical protein
MSLFSRGYRPIPEHTRETLINYFVYGYSPGGFITAVLAGDLYLAIGRADSQNRQGLAEIALWIRENAPPGSWGSYEQVDHWLKDTGNMRSAFAEMATKELMWDTLKND